jgi:hypothetical protein
MEMDNSPNKHNKFVDNKIKPRGYDGDESDDVRMNAEIEQRRKDE